MIKLILTDYEIYIDSIIKLVNCAVWSLPPGSCSLVLIINFHIKRRRRRSGALQILDSCKLQLAQSPALRSLSAFAQVSPEFVFQICSLWSLFKAWFWHGSQFSFCIILCALIFRFSFFFFFGLTESRFSSL